MAKQVKPDNLIADELRDAELKVKEFQSYLKLNNIVSQVAKGSEILITEENQDKLHKEILLQIKMQDAVFVWLPLLRKYREIVDEASIETHGDVEINGLYKKKNDDK